MPIWFHYIGLFLGAALIASGCRSSRWWHGYAGLLILSFAFIGVLTH